MSSIPGKTYDLKSVILIIGGVRISGFGEGGAVSVEMASDIGDDTVGADGQVVFSRNNDNRVYVDITVGEWTIAHKQLGALLNAQHPSTGATAITPVSFLMEDLINGDKLADNYAVFKTRPAPVKGKGASDRTYRLMLPNAAANMIYGANISV